MKAFGGSTDLKVPRQSRFRLISKELGKSRQLETVPNRTTTQKHRTLVAIFETAFEWGETRTENRLKREGKGKY